MKIINIVKYYNCLALSTIFIFELDTTNPLKEKILRENFGSVGFPFRAGNETREMENTVYARLSAILYKNNIAPRKSAEEFVRLGYFTFEELKRIKNGK